MTTPLRLNRSSLVRSLAVATLALTLSSLQAQEEWTEVKDIKGRALTVQITKVEGDQVSFKTKQGKTYTKAISTFSVQDQLMLKTWKPSAQASNPVIEDAKLQLVNSSAQQTVFRSKHFEFQILGAAKVAQVNAFTPVFEATYWAFEKLPIQLTPTPSGSHFKCQLYLTESDFEVASREKLQEGQAAIYNLDQDVLLAPIDKLQSGQALIKEIAFALLGQRLLSMPPWLAVGISEYLAAAPYQDNALDLADPLNNVRARLQTVYALNEKTVPMLAPGDVFDLDYPRLRAAGLEGQKSRSSALMLFYFLAFLDDDGKAKGLQDYWRAIRTNAPAEESTEALLAGRSPEKLQDDLKIAYVAKQMRVAFIQ